MIVHKELQEDGRWKITATLDNGDIIEFSIKEHRQTSQEASHLGFYYAKLNGDSIEFSTMDTNYHSLADHLELKRRR